MSLKSEAKKYVMLTTPVRQDDDMYNTYHTMFGERSQGKTMTVKELNRKEALYDTFKGALDHLSSVMEDTPYSQTQYDQASARAKRGDKAGETLRSCCTKENTGQVPKESPKMIECPECKGEGTLDRCGGDCYFERNKICNGMDTGECEDGYLICKTCEGTGEIEMKSLSKEGIKEYIRCTHDGRYGKPYDFEELVIDIVSRHQVYKSHLLSAIAEVYLIPPHVVRSGVSYSQGEGKNIYDSLGMFLETLADRGVLEPYTKGKPLKLKKPKLVGCVVGINQSLTGDVVTIPSGAYTPQAISQVCPDCLGEGRVKESMSCGSFTYPCKTCKGEGTIKVPTNPEMNIFIDTEAIKQKIDSIKVHPRKRREHKRYEVSNEEVKVKRGKHKARKYNIIKGELK